MVGLLLVLLLLVLGVSSPHSETRLPTITTVMPAKAPPFTVDGKAPAVRAGAVTLRRGELLRFDRPISVLKVDRLECMADVHRISVAGSTWRVPGLPTGLYALSTAGGDGQLARVRSHAAPCP